MSKPDLDLTALRQAYEEERQGQRNRSVEWWLNHIRALLDALEQAQRERDELRTRAVLAENARALSSPRALAAPEAP